MEKFLTDELKNCNAERLGLQRNQTDALMLAHRDHKKEGNPELVNVAITASVGFLCALVSAGATIYATRRSQAMTPEVIRQILNSSDFKEMLQTVLEDHHKELVPEISAQLAEVVKVMKTYPTQVSNMTVSKTLR
jgi:hypothetical protein